MSDLISRSAVIELLRKNMTSDIQDQIITENNINLICAIPTAYDVEKVIEELEEMQVKAEKDMQLSDNVAETNAYGGMMLAYGLAIPIVEKGGAK